MDIQFRGNTLSGDPAKHISYAVFIFNSCSTQAGASKPRAKTLASLSVSSLIAKVRYDGVFIIK